MTEELKELVRSRNNEISRVQLLETIKVTRVITKVETILATVLILLNVAALVGWYFSGTDVVDFLKYYLTIGIVVNVLSIVLHNRWENKYIEKKASNVVQKVNFIRVEYSGRIKPLLDKPEEEEKTEE